MPSRDLYAQAAARLVTIENSNGRYVCEVGPTPAIKLRKSLKPVSVQQVRVRTKARLAQLATDPSKVRRYETLRALLRELRQCLRGEGRFAQTVPPADDNEDQTPPSDDAPPLPTATPTPTPTPERTRPPLLEADRRIVVQAFNYYYPDMPVAAHEILGNRIELELPRGQTGYATFLYEAAYDREEVQVRPLDLFAQNGAFIPRESVKVGVVEVLDQYRSISTNLQNIWLRGNHLEQTEDRRRVQQKVQAHQGQAPLPFLVVPNLRDFQLRTRSSVGSLVLPKRIAASAPVTAGERRQFWISVQVPPHLDVGAPQRVFDGALEIETDGAVSSLPMQVTVHNFELDSLERHNKALGIYRAVTELPAEFRDAALEDLKTHNVNMIIDSSIYPADYERLIAAGFDDVVSLDGGLSAPELQYVRSLNLRNLALYTRDEPEYLVDDPNSGTDGWDVFVSRYNLLSQAGMTKATAGLYAPSNDWYFWNYPHEWFAISFRTSWNSDHPTVSYLNSLASNPLARIATRQGHYSPTLSERYYLMTRLLYGPWLALSNLDFGAPYAYAPNVQTTDILGYTEWEGVAFPVQFTNPDGSIASYEILSNQVWDAFGDAGKMFRLVLMGRRLANEVGTAADRDRFEALVAPYRYLFPPGYRIDTLNFNSDLDELQRDLLELIGELITRPAP